jgi:cytochrome c oxidase cbb3-type subunit III
MFLKMRRKIVHILSFLPVLLFMNILPLHAEGNDVPSSLTNPVVDVLVVLMVVLLIVIATLGKLLLDIAEVKLEKDKKEKETTGIAAITTIVLLLSGSTIQAQTNDVATSSTTIAGMSSFAFYTIMTIVFLELFVILGLLFNIRSLLRKEKEKAESAAATEAVKKPAVTWWSKFNRFKPVEQEADIDLGHDYDGIRELDNRLPPWWLYGFYLTIVVAIIYLWRFHVSHTGPSSKEEYETAVASAEIEIKAYLEKKGDAVDENTVTVLTSADDIAAGKTIFLKSCAACHKETGAGDVGPNLTDNYWLHGGDIKSIFKTIRYGINAMPQWQSSYSNKQIAQVAGFVKSLKGTSPANAKAPQGELYNEDGAASIPDSTSGKAEATLK